MISLPELLTNQREKLNLKRADVVRRLEERGHPIGVAAYGHYERGARIPNYTTAEQLAAVLELPFSDVCKAAGITERQRSSEAA
jgi:DNA-binding XRE family transcriptional regulator